MTFEEFQLNPQILDGLKDAGYVTPTPVQEQCISLIIEGKDIIASASTGTGKTGAFVIPILQILSKTQKKGVRALILTPTRELASQIDELIWGIGFHTGLSSVNIIGGSDWGGQNQALKDGANIVVATPGRLMDQIQDLNLDLTNIEFFVLDEADRMMDMGFLPQVLRVIEKLPENRQNLLFSATMPNKVQSIIAKMMKEPATIKVDSYKPADTIEQKVYFLPEHQKIRLIEHLIKSEDWKSTIIFSSTKRGTEKLYGSLQKRGFKVAAIHGDRTQEEREKALNQFKSGEANVLVATDVIARGIDIEEVSHIINFDVPRDTDDYIHRIGRTGRADSKGEAVTLVSQFDERSMESIKKTVNLNIVRMEVPDEVRQADKQQERRPQHHQNRNQPDRQQEVDPNIQIEALVQESMQTAPEQKPQREPNRNPNQNQNNQRRNNYNNNRNQPRTDRNPNERTDSPNRNERGPRSQPNNQNRSNQRPEFNKSADRKPENKPRQASTTPKVGTQLWQPEESKGIVGFFKKLFGKK